MYNDREDDFSKRKEEDEDDETRDEDEEDEEDRTDDEDTTDDEEDEDEEDMTPRTKMRHLTNKNRDLETELDGYNKTSGMKRGGAYARGQRIQEIHKNLADNRAEIGRLRRNFNARRK